jgi:hypothetical protein
MNIDAINRQLSPARPIDWFAPGAAMQLAWFWTAQELWSDRDFTSNARALFSAKLAKAWAHVKTQRRWLQRQAAARTDARVQALLARRDRLQNQPFSISIRAEQNSIDAQIDAILDAG